MSSKPPIKTSESPKHLNPRLVVGLLTLGSIGAVCMAIATASPPAEARKNQVRSALRSCINKAIRETATLPEQDISGSYVVFKDIKNKEVARIALGDDYEITGMAMADSAMNENLVRAAGAINRRCGAIVAAYNRS